MQEETFINFSTIFYVIENKLIASFDFILIKLCYFKFMLDLTGNNLIFNTVYMCIYLRH